MYLIKTKSGSYSPLDDSDYEFSKTIKPGSVVSAQPARNFQFHKKAFQLLNLGWENSSDEPFEVYRMKITIRAGFIEWTKDKNGNKFPLPKSLSYEKMNAETFEKWYKSVLDIIAKDLETKPEEVQVALVGFE